jgi:hypothetical protein
LPAKDNSLEESFRQDTAIQKERRGDKSQ